MSKKILSFLLVTSYQLLAVPKAFAQAKDLGSEFSFGQIKSLGQAFGYLIQPGFAIAAIAVLLYLIVGAFRLVISGGDKNAVQGARDSIVHAIIGFILLMLMFVLLQFVPEFLGISNEFRIIK